ncbi:hypothetical protein LEP1GSC137_1702 [Leptospira borgpetersenii str. Noumea 25]|nr:hypothetical protein LEP1GSC137_1702 [Leptospira borgpetersenii str. Noumea 25]
MPNGFPHLPLPLVRQDRARLRGGGKKSQKILDNENNRQGHFNQISGALAKNLEFHSRNQKDRSDKGFPPILAGIPLLIRVEEDSDLDFLRAAFEFEIVSQQEDGYVIVASQDLDFQKLNVSLTKFLAEERGGGQVAKLYEIITDIDLEHRFKRIVDPYLFERIKQLSSDQVTIIDFSVECLGQLPKAPERKEGLSEERYQGLLNKFQIRLKEFNNEWEKIRLQREKDIIELINLHNGEVLTITEDPASYLPDSFTIRASITVAGLKDIVDSYPFIFEASEPDEIGKKPISKMKLQLINFGRCHLRRMLLQFAL